MGAAEERCRGCGSMLAGDARFCARCGRGRGDPAAPTIVELTPFGAPVEQRATVTTRPPDRRRTLVVLGALVVVGFVAFGLTKLLGDDGGTDAAPASSTSTTLGPGVFDATTTTLAPTTSAAATTTVQTSSTTAPPTTTTIPYVNQRRGLVLDAAQQDRALVIANVNSIVRVDLGTGLVTTRNDLRGVLGGPLWRVGDQLLVLGNPVRVLQADLGGDVQERILSAGFGAWPQDGVDATGFWAIDYPESAGDATRVRRYDVSGAVRSERAVPAGLGVMGFVADRVVLARSGRIWTMGADERLVPYAVGSISAVQHGWVLWLGCDDTGRCTYHLGDATRPDTGRTSLEATYLYAYGGGEGGGYAQALSPDGATLVSPVATARDGLPRIVDLATGSVLETSGQGTPAFAWTPDGAWLVEINGTIVTATNVRTGARRTLAVPGLNGASLTGVTIG